MIITANAEWTKNNRKKKKKTLSYIFFIFKVLFNIEVKSH